MPGTSLRTSYIIFATPRAIITGEFLFASTVLEIAYTVVECTAKVIILSRNPEQTTKSVAELRLVSPRRGLCATQPRLSRSIANQSGELEGSGRGRDLVCAESGRNFVSAKTL